jgi:hypothetical protein
MTGCILFIPGTNKPRPVPPPLPPDGGGFWYLKRVRDGAVLLHGNGYVSFPSEDEARKTAKRFPDQIGVHWMPKMRTN